MSMTPREAIDLLAQLPVPIGTKLANGATEALAVLDSMVKRSGGMECWFCSEPAVTIGYGFALCGGDDCTSTARVIAESSVTGTVQNFRYTTFRNPGHGSAPSPA